MHSKIHTCQPQTATLLAPFWLDDVSQSGKRPPIRKGQSVWRFVAGTYESCYALQPLEYTGILIFSRASSGPFGWIFDWKVREESWIFWPLCCEVWKRSDAILAGKIAPALEPFKTRFPPLSFSYKDSQRRTQIHSKSFKKPLLRQKDVLHHR